MTTPLRLIALLLAALALVATAAGCGKSGPTPAQQEAARRASFIHEADLICFASERQIRALKQPSSFPELRTFVRKGLKITRVELKALHGLKAPESLKARWTAYLEQLDASLLAAEDLGHAAKTQRNADLQAALKESTRIGKRLRTISKQIGFTECSKPQPSSTG